MLKKGGQILFLRKSGGGLSKSSAGGGIWHETTWLLKGTTMGPSCCSTHGTLLLVFHTPAVEHGTLYGSDICPLTWYKTVDWLSYLKNILRIESWIRRTRWWWSLCKKWKLHHDLSFAIWLSSRVEWEGNRMEFCCFKPFMVPWWLFRFPWCQAHSVKLNSLPSLTGTSQIISSEIHSPPRQQASRTFLFATGSGIKKSTINHFLGGDQKLFPVLRIFGLHLRNGTTKDRRNKTPVCRQLLQWNHFDVIDPAW